jgi:hypothetical protein
MIVVLAIFFLVRGMVRIQSGRAGVNIVYFNAVERLVHWMTATCFVLLATDRILAGVYRDCCHRRGRLSSSRRTAAAERRRVHERPTAHASTRVGAGAPYSDERASVTKSIMNIPAGPAEMAEGCEITASYQWIFVDFGYQEGESRLCTDSQ